MWWILIELLWLHFWCGTFSLRSHNSSLKSTYIQMEYPVVVPGSTALYSLSKLRNWILGMWQQPYPIIFSLVHYTNIWVLYSSLIVKKKVLKLILKLQETICFINLYKVLVGFLFKVKFPLHLPSCIYVNLLEKLLLAFQFFDY